jgi:hypothetical protein
MCLCFLKFCLWGKLFSRQAVKVGHSTESHRIYNMLAGFCEKLMHVWAQWKKMTCLTIWPPEWLFCFQEGLGCMELACICCLEYCIYHHMTPAFQRYAPQYLSFFSNCVQTFGQSIWRISVIFIVILRCVISVVLGK